MYINAVADRVMLYLQHDFYNTIFKIKHRLYIASGSAPSKETFWVRIWLGKMRSTLLWDITQRRMVILYRRFGTTFRSHLQGSRSLRRNLGLTDS
jgi:hypothetical protein